MGRFLTDVIKYGINAQSIITTDSRQFITTMERDILDENIYTFIYKGNITLASDFPTAAAVQSGWVYLVLADPSVTDNDATKTNTGTTWSKDTKIFWNKDDTWEIFTSNTLLWKSVGDSLESIIPTDNINLVNGGLKDTNVTTEVKLGDVNNTELDTTNKTLIGAINEVKNASNLFQITSSANNETKVLDSFILTVDGAYKYEYLISDGANIRAGQLTTIWDTPSATVKHLEFSTNSIGDTEDFVFSADVDAGAVRLLATTTGNYITIKLNRYSF